MWCLFFVLKKFIVFISFLLFIFIFIFIFSHYYLCRSSINRFAKTFERLRVVLYLLRTESPFYPVFLCISPLLLSKYLYEMGVRSEPKIQIQLSKWNQLVILTSHTNETDGINETTQHGNFPARGWLSPCLFTVNPWLQNNNATRTSSQ